MNKKICKLIFLSLLFSLILGTSCFAGKLDPTIPTFDDTTMSLSDDGTAYFTPPYYEGNWKRFDLQLLKRVSTITAVGTVIFTYKTTGSIKYCKYDETEYSFKFPSVGYYQFQIRGENLEGNYGQWMRMSGGEEYDYCYQGVAIDEENISIDTGGGSGSGGGPGVITTDTLPAGYQYAVIGPNGQILYYYGGNQSPYQNGYNNGSQFYGPGYVNNGVGGGSVLYPNTGITNYPLVPSPIGGTQQGTYAFDPVTGTYVYTGGNTGTVNPTQGTSNATNPNYSGMQNVINSSVSPTISQGLEIGWHVDANGRFYYQGNGILLKGTWFLIDNEYYRFSDNGYLLVNQWFKDNGTGSWYYLSGDGKMLIGWQKIGGVWYYFKPEKGNGYGTMYANTSLQINDSTWGSGVYAFDSNGAMVQNAWYGGFYYGQDGRRAS